MNEGWTSPSKRYHVTGTGRNKKSIMYDPVFDKDGFDQYGVDKEGNVPIPRRSHWASFLNKQKVKKFEFEAFKVDESFDFEDCREYGIYIDDYVDETTGDVLCMYKGKIIGVPCLSIFGADDGGVLQGLWSDNGGKTAHALDAKGNVISPEFVGIYDKVPDIDLLLDTNGYVHLAGSYVKSDSAIRNLSRQICKIDEIIGLTHAEGTSLFFKQGKDIKWVNLLDDDVIHSAPIHKNIPLNRYNLFDWHA